MTVTMKLKDADKDSQKKINFMPCMLVSVLFIWYNNNNSN